MIFSQDRQAAEKILNLFVDERSLKGVETCGEREMIIEKRDSEGIIIFPQGKRTLEIRNWAYLWTEYEGELHVMTRPGAGVAACARRDKENK